MAEEYKQEVVNPHYEIPIYALESITLRPELTKKRKYHEFIGNESDKDEEKKSKQRKVNEEA